MRILHIVHQFPPERVGGTEVYTLGAAKELLNRGHQVFVFHRAPGKAGVELIDWEGVTVYRASDGPMTPMALFRSTFRNQRLLHSFAQVFQKVKPDLIHIQHLMGLPVSLVKLITQERIPFLLTLHDYWFICPNAQLLTNTDQAICQGPQNGGINCAHCALYRANAPFLRPLAPILVPLFLHRRKILQSVLNRASGIISPSQFLIKMMIDWGAPAERLSCLPNGIDTTGVHSRSAHQNLPLRFAYIGGLAPQKGVHVLIDAFNQLKTDAALEVYGDLDQFPDYVQSLRNRVRSPRISFGGRLERNGVWRVLSEVDALLMPSLWFENAPVVIQEAFAAGLPVIASNLGAITEWIRDKVDGILVPPGDVKAWRDVVQRVVNDPNLLVQLGARARPPMTIESHLDQLESRYEMLINNCKGGLWV